MSEEGKLVLSFSSCFCLKYSLRVLWLSVFQAVTPPWRGRVWTRGRGLFFGPGRWSSRLMAELGQGAGLSTWPWQTGGHWGGSASAAVTRGKNNQRRTAASLSATKREIKLTSPPAKTCSPVPWLLPPTA